MRALGACATTKNDCNVMAIATIKGGGAPPIYRVHILTNQTTRRIAPI
jgi:hypothetical protein